ALANVSLNSLALISGNERSQFRFGIQRVTELQARDGSRRELPYLRHPRTRNDHACPCGACLTRVQHRIVDTSRDRFLHRRIIEDHERGFSSELECDFLDGL